MRTNLRSIRIREGITITGLAHASNLSAKTISKAERGRDLRTISLYKIVNGLNVFTGKQYELEEIFPDIQREPESRMAEEIEIKISKSFNEFSDADEESLINAIKQILSTDDIVIKRKRKGSVKVSLELSHNQVMHLVKAMSDGALSEYGVTSASVTPSFHIEKSETIDMQNLAFIIMKFGDDVLDSAYDGVIRPLLIKYGYNPIRIDEVQDSGKITDQIIEYISNAKLVIADLSGERPNCYYESGFAHALGKNIIFSIMEKDAIHFDLAGHRFITWKTEKEFRKKLNTRLQSIRRKP
jgi:transcriptional regulator with XRE-family HTH domain